MADLLAIMDRLAAHIRVAHAAFGAAITKTSGFYGDRLEGLSDDQRAQVLAVCQTHGCAAQFGRTGLGGVNLTLTTAHGHAAGQ